jgi:hypothetical protein
LLGIITLPSAIFVIFSILNEDITFVDENSDWDLILEEE